MDSDPFADGLTMPMMCATFPPVAALLAFAAAGRLYAASELTVFDVAVSEYSDEYASTDAAGPLTIHRVPTTAETTVYAPKNSN